MMLSLKEVCNPYAYRVESSAESVERCSGYGNSGSHALASSSFQLFVCVVHFVGASSVIHGIDLDYAFINSAVGHKEIRSGNCEVF